MSCPPRQSLSRREAQQPTTEALAVPTIAPRVQTFASEGCCISLQLRYQLNFEACGEARSGWPNALQLRKQALPVIELPAVRMMKASEPSRSSSGQILWAIFIVLIALWVIAFAAHLGGGVITYLLIVSLAVLLIRSAGSRAKTAPVQEGQIKGSSTE